MSAYKIDKTKFTAEDLAIWNQLVAKGMVEVDPANGSDHMEEEPAAPAVQKAAPEMAPEIKAAMDELANLKKSYEMDKMVEVAKKYAPLGKNETELAQTLFDMKKSNEANYNAYIAVLDESLSYVEKSGLFAEIGKSVGGVSTPVGAVGKIEAAANDIMKSDSSLTREQAIAKAWEDNPDLALEYEKERG